MALWSVSLFTFGGWEGCCGTLCLNKALARNQCPSWLVAEGCDQSHQILAQPFDVQASASSTMGPCCTHSLLGNLGSLCPLRASVSCL